MYQLKVNKFGKNKVGMWVLGELFDVQNNITYKGLINLDNEYAIIEDTTYPVKSISLRNDKKGILRITIAL